MKYLINSRQVVRILGDLGPLLPFVAGVRGYGEALQDIVEKFKDAGISPVMGWSWITGTMVFIGKSFRFMTLIEVSKLL